MSQDEASEERAGVLVTRCLTALNELSTQMQQVPEDVRWQAVVPANSYLWWAAMTVRHGSPEARQLAETADVYRELAANPRVPAHRKYAVLNTIGVAYLRAERYEQATKVIKEGIAANNGKAGTLDQTALVTSAFYRGRESDVAAKIEDLEAATSTRESGWTEGLETHLLLTN